MASDQKRDLIVQAALRRFAGFGVAKTTMNEIAGDLSISKPLLYYYFPDKMRLFAAVLELILAESKEKYEAAAGDADNPIETILLFLDRRAGFILRYYKILEYLRKYSPENLPDPLKQLFDRLKKQQVERIAGIVQRGVDQGFFKVANARKTAVLYYELLEGVRQPKHSGPRFFLPDQKQLKAQLAREREFSIIFMHGLTCER